MHSCVPSLVLCNRTSDRCAPAFLGSRAPADSVFSVSSFFRSPSSLADTPYRGDSGGRAMIGDRLAGRAGRIRRGNAALHLDGNGTGGEAAVSI